MPESKMDKTIDVSEMTLTNYKYDYYLGKNLVKTGDIGTAKYLFKGVPAFYNINVLYVDEDDGNCAYTVFVDGEKVDYWVANQNPDKDCIFTRSINNVKLSSRSSIVVEGKRNEGESARLANIVIEYSYGISLLPTLKFALGQFVESTSVATFFLVGFIIILFLSLNIIAFTFITLKKWAIYKDNPDKDSTINNIINSNPEKCYHGFDKSDLYSKSSYLNNEDQKLELNIDPLKCEKVDEDENTDNSYPYYQKNQYKIEVIEGFSEDNGVVEERPEKYNKASCYSIDKLSDKNTKKVFYPEDEKTIKDSPQKRYKYTPVKIEENKEKKIGVPVSDKMILYLEKNYCDSNFTVQSMADYFGISLNYLSSLFKDQTGQNIVYYLTCLRIEKAKELLSSSDIPIKGVAENSGYFNVSSFIRRFKQITGVTPGEFRQNNYVKGKESDGFDSEVNGDA